MLTEWGQGASEMLWPHCCWWCEWTPLEEPAAAVTGTGAWEEGQATGVEEKGPAYGTGCSLGAQGEAL